MDSIQQRIAEIAERGRQKAQERRMAEERRIESEREMEQRRHLSRLADSGLPEWMAEYLGYSHHNNDRFYTLALPGCSDISFLSRGRSDPWYAGIRVSEALVVKWSDDAEKWFVHRQYHTLEPSSDLDEAIALSANYGESWHAMHADADRRNSEGLRPEPKPQPAPEPDLLAQAGELLRKYQMTLATPKIDPAVVVTSAVLAVAAELRAVCNALQDGAA